VEVLGYAVAALPFVVAGVALLGLRWPATRAGAAALAGALLWPALSPGGLPEAVWAGLGTSGNVLFVLFGGLLLYNVLSAGGAVERISAFLGRLEPDRSALAAVIVVGIAPFFESVTGFGVAVVISAPILLAAGFSPLRTAALASWGQCAVPWGALGVGTVIGADLAGTTFRELSDASAWLNLPLFPVYSLFALVLAGGRGELRRRGLEAAVLGLAAGLGTLLTSLYLIPELAGAAGGLAATAAFLAPRRDRLRRLAVPGRDLAPYGVLLALLVAANGLAPLRRTMETLGPVFAGPGLWLVASAAFAAVLLGVGPALGRVAGGTGRQWLPVAGAVLTFVLAGQVVASSGAAALLAGGAVGGLGSLYPPVSPAVGALGGVLTGSNAASNALFMPFQAEAARAAETSTLSLAALQNAAGSHASMLAPQRLVLAATAVGMVGRESEIVRAVAPPVLVSLAILTVAGLACA
jgi:lactate permease